MADSGGFEGAPPAEGGSLEDAISAATAPAPEGARPAPEQVNPAAPADWREGLDPETRSLVEAKGFRDPADLVRWGREAEATMHRERQRAEQVEQQMLQSQQPQQPDGAPQYTEADVFAAMESGEIGAREAAAYMAQLTEYRESRLLSQMDERLSRYDTERVQPLGQVQAAEMLRGEIASVQAQVGPEEVQRYGRRAVEIARERQMPFTDAFKMVRGEAEMQRAMEARRSQYAETMNGGGRGPAQQAGPDPIEKLTEEIFGNAGPVTGGFD